MSSRTILGVLMTALFALSTAGCEKRQAPKAEEPEREVFGRMTVDELDAKLAAAKAGTIKLAVFDNNERARFAQSHIPGAKWVKFDAVKASDLPEDKATTLVFYCSNEL